MPSRYRGGPAGLCGDGVFWCGVLRGDGVDQGRLQAQLAHPCWLSQQQQLSSSSVVEPFSLEPGFDYTRVQATARWTGRQA